MFKNLNSKKEINNTKENSNCDYLLKERVKKDSIERYNKTQLTHNISLKFKELDFMTENLINAINNVSESVNKQIEYSEAVICKMKDFYHSSQDITTSTEVLQSLSEETLNAVTEGKTDVDKSITSMENISSSVMLIKKVNDELNEKLVNIYKSVNIIQDISKQTNLLSLNASIEAARSGEAGKGFGVIANEIKSLSQDITSFSKEINKTILEIKQSMELSNNSLYGVNKEVASGVSISNNTSDNFNIIVKSIAETKNSIDTITKSIESQSEKIADIIKFSKDNSELANEVLVSIELELMNIYYTENITQSVSRLIELLKTLNKDDGTSKEREKITLKTGIDRGIVSIDPAKSSDVEDLLIITNVHSSLLMQSQEGSILPGIAKNWTSTNENKTWVFNLRQGVKFHNGDYLTAEDVKYSLERLLDPKISSQNGWILKTILGVEDFENGKCDEIRGIKILNKYQLEITTTEPFSYLLSNLSTAYCSIVCKREIMKGNVVGCGAFFIKEHVNNKITLSSFDSFYGGRAYIDELIIEFNVKNYLDRYKNNEYDFIKIGAVDELNEIKRENSSIDVNLKSILGLQFFAFNFYGNSIFTKNSDLRRAIALAMDSEYVVKNICKDIAEPAYTYVPAWKGKRAFDIEEARKIIRSNYPNETLTLKVIVEDYPFQRRISKVFIEWMKDIGLNVDLTFSKNNIMDFRDVKEYDCVFSGWVADSPDYVTYLEPILAPDGSGIFGYRNEEANIIWEEIKTTVNPQKRDMLLEKFERIILKDMPIVPLYFMQNGIIHKDNINNALIDVLGGIKFDTVIKN